jgi:hypothetical protein
MAEDSAAWVYAATATIPPVTLTGLAGVSGARVHAVRAGDLAAAVSTVSQAQFGEQPLRQHLEDLAWLERTARAHHHVIETVLDGRPGVPMRLATLYYDDTGVAAMLAARRAEITAALDRVAGRAEWGVKLYAVPHGETTPPAGAATPPGAPGLGPGAGYLKRRQAELSAREDDRREAMAVAGVMHATLAGLASAACRRPPQAAELTDAAESMVLNGTYLVQDRRSARFAAAARELAGQSPAFRLQLTGPWPPYSFTAFEDPGPDE